MATILVLCHVNEVCKHQTLILHLETSCAVSAATFPPSDFHRGRRRNTMKHDCVSYKNKTNPNVWLRSAGRFPAVSVLLESVPVAWDLVWFSAYSGSVGLCIAGLVNLREGWKGEALQNEYTLCARSTWRQPSYRIYKIYHLCFVFLLDLHTKILQNKITKRCRCHVESGARP